MLDIEEINNTISMLENSDTTFDTCLKLSALYNVREHLQPTVKTTVERELDDVLPAYNSYVEVKKQYQQGLLPENAVISRMQQVCREIEELITTIYSGTDMPEERECLYNIVGTLYQKYQ